ncbi:uncharacterized protein EI97DRAFT_388231 [Westerdykella ornata]|uniref:Serine hydrolase domain-containing protein n=1 Tax=Westerdykella ornata TaxID=318751 RepID=A0A6A6J405_WESOR|nr:uncharacterized protein EI97DRAFT_388231 [Westerdykella ornata]KAF2271300.1 hypothetical protein EI97DRAFT_388231 [Westerdykella ornata]
MKILTLHGLGSSASMLKEQIAPFMRELGPSYQFTFVDGEIPCGRGPGVPHWATGPFFSYAAGFSPPQVQNALDRLDQFIREKGPFDGILGFSLGAALAMLHKKLCMASLTQVHTHKGAHDIPFTRSDVKSIVSSIRNVAEELIEWGAG